MQGIVRTVLIITPGLNEDNMASTSLSLVNISCTCTECTSFLRPYPKTTPFSDPTSLPITPPLTAESTPRSVPRSTTSTPNPSTQLRPTAPTLAPSPQFLLTRPSPPKDPQNTPATTPSNRVAPIVTLLSRRLLFNLSSPIDEGKTPLSAKTPGLKQCAGTDCAAKVLPGFGRAVCRTCEQDLKGAVQGLLSGGEETQSSTTVEESVGSRALAENTYPYIMLEQPEAETEPHAPYHNDDAENKHLLFALPSASLTRHQHRLLSPSPNASPRSFSPSKRLALKHERAGTAVGTPLFALPDIVALDTPMYKETAPTIKYSADFPALPVSRDGDLGRERSAARPQSGIIQMTAVWTENRHRRKAGRPYELPASRWEGARSRTKRVA